MRIHLSGNLGLIPTFFSVFLLVRKLFLLPPIVYNPLYLWFEFPLLARAPFFHASQGITPPQLDSLRRGPKRTNPGSWVGPS